MSLIDCFTTRPNVAVADDLIWMTPEAKLNGLVAQVQDRLDENLFVLVLAHFPATLASVEQELSANGVPNEFHDDRLSRKNIVPLIDDDNGLKVLLGLADSLAPDEFPMEINDSLKGLAILVTERHFLREKDEAISSFARSLGRPCELLFHLSLHDPLIDNFAGDWVKYVLMRLGLDKSKAIESKLVAKGIKTAQAKFTAEAFSDRATDSAEEWLRLNVPHWAVR